MAPPPLHVSQPGTKNITLYKDRTFYLLATPKVNGVPLDNTGFVAKLQIRSSAKAADPALVDLSSDDSEEVVLGGVEGWIWCRIGSDVTQDLDAPSYAVYDLALFETAEATEKWPILEGEVEIRETVTR